MIGAGTYGKEHMRKQVLAKASLRPPYPLPEAFEEPGCRSEQVLPTQAPAEAKKLLTDRAAYIAYLESQLERVSAACLTVQSFDERVESVTSSANLLQEKVRPLPDPASAFHHASCSSTRSPKHVPCIAFVRATTVCHAASRLSTSRGRRSSTRMQPSGLMRSCRPR